MNFANIDLAIQREIARITLNRPDKLNSFNEETLVELSPALDIVESSPAARVLVLTGTGRAFCAGQDLADPAMQAQGNAPPDIGAVVERHYKPLVLRLQDLCVPTIAAVNGLAAGGGASLALACDLVVAAKSAYFLQAFSRIGLTPDTGSTWFLAHKVGSARAIGRSGISGKACTQVHGAMTGCPGLDACLIKRVRRLIHARESRSRSDHRPAAVRPDSRRPCLY